MEQPKRLEAFLRVLRENGVTRYKSAELEVDLSARSITASPEMPDAQEEREAETETEDDILFGRVS